MEEKKPPDDERSQLSEDEDDEAPPERGGFAAKMLGDLARRALTTGIGAVFMSEDALRSSLSEMKLPKEAMNYVVSQADKTKREIVTAIARETRSFLGNLEIDKVVARVLTGTTVEIQTRIRILPKEGGGVSMAVEKNTANLERTDSDSAAGEERPRRRTRRSRRTGEAPSNPETELGHEDEELG